MLSTQNTAKGNWIKLSQLRAHFYASYIGFVVSYIGMYVCMYVRMYICAETTKSIQEAFPFLTKAFLHKKQTDTNRCLTDV